MDTGADKDLALTDEDAEGVVGGAKKTTKTHKDVKSATQAAGGQLIEGHLYANPPSGDDSSSIYDPEGNDPTDPAASDYVGP